MTRPVDSTDRQGGRSADPAAASVLLVTAREDLLDDLLRLSAAAGVIPDVAPDSAAALRTWSTAGVVLVGADQAAPLADRRPPHRAGVHLVSPGHAADPLFRSAVALGAASVLELPDANPWLVELLADAADGARTPALTVGVVAGCGGAGATTFACSLALTAATTAEALLVDADPLGGGAERVAGLDEEQGIRWDALVGSGGRLSWRSLRDALPRRGDLAVLGWPPADRCRLDVGTAREVLSASQRGNRVVVVDLPRELDEAAAWMAAACDSVVVVARPGVPATVAAGRVLSRLRELVAEPLLAVRGIGKAVPAEDVAAVLGAPLLVAIGEHRRLGEWVDLGLGPVHRGRGPCASAARAALRHWLAAGSGDRRARAAVPGQ